MKSPFNDYDAEGFRINILGNRTSRIADESILYNLRARWPEELKQFSDVQLLNEYDAFALSDAFGDNDANFLEWINAGEKK